MSINDKLIVSRQHVGENFRESITDCFITNIVIVREISPEIPCHKFFSNNKKISVHSTYYYYCFPFIIITIYRNSVSNRFISSLVLQANFPNFLLMVIVTFIKTPFPELLVIKLYTETFQLKKLNPLDYYLHTVWATSETAELKFGTKHHQKFRQYQSNAECVESTDKYW